MAETPNNYKPIGSDSINIYGFRFGSHIYQVEHFDHGHRSDDTKNMFSFLSVWDQIRGTRVYRFNAGIDNPVISSVILFDMFIEENELKSMILEDKIVWKFEDPYEYKDYFDEGKFKWNLSGLFPEEKGDVKLPYPECDEPFDQCPICGGKFDDDLLERSDPIDCFNSYVRYGFEGELEGWWQEVHRCPYCEKLFYREVEP